AIGLRRGNGSGRGLRATDDDDGEEREGGGAETGGVALMTRDLLGGGCCTQLGSKELGLDLKAPFGWEKRMDMASGEVYLQRCTSVVFESHKKVEHDLNLPQLAPSSWRSDDSDSLAPGLDLALNLPTSPERSNLSVCTIEKVRSARSNLYVLICRRNPKCPRCDAIVPMPSPSSSPSSSSFNKKPRLDLNSSVGL
ncbi:hypothetical protein EJ110_NYTH35000, partial [Nymphaea thermarum]